VTAVFGTAFSKITYAPTPSVAASRIAFARGLFYASTQLYVANSNDPNSAHTLPGTFDASGGAPSWSRDGRIAFNRNITGKYEIWVVNADGSNLHRISNPAANDTSPAWAPDNFHIAYAQYTTTGQIYSMTASGGSVTLLSDGTADDSDPIWTPDSTQILFLRFNPNTGFHEIWRMNANGSSPIKLYGPNEDITGIAMSPLGTQLTFTLSTGPLYIIDYPGFTTGAPLANTANTTNQLATWAPDASKIMFQSGSNGVSELDTVTGDALNRATFLNYSDNSLGGPAWEPFPVPQPFVSSTGGYVFGNASSGFLYGLNGDGFASFLNFTCTTPTSAVVTSDPVTPGQSNLIYRISGDAITSLKFMNGFGGAVQAPTLAAGTKQVTVAFNSKTGSIVSVLVGLKRTIGR